MAGFSRHVEVTWTGGLMDGKGEAKAGTNAFTLPVTFASRIGEPEGKTSPEELLAASHASCYAMALNGTLGRKQAKMASVSVTATILADKSDTGIKVAKSTLTVVAHGLEGIDASQFAEVAREAETRCPISNALRNNVEIVVETSVV